MTFERFAEQEFWSEKDLDPFVRSHPVAAHRLNQLREKVAASPYANDKDPPQLQHRHDMMRAKLEGHVLAPADRLQPLSRERHQPARALRARHRPQLLGRLRAGDPGDRCADSRPAGLYAAGGAPPSRVPCQAQRTSAQALPPVAMPST